MAEKLIKNLLNRGFSITPDALRVLTKSKNRERIVDALVRSDNKPLIITRDIIESITGSGKNENKEMKMREKSPKARPKDDLQKEKPKERLDELDGKTWTRYSISIWDVTKTPGEMRLKHPAMFPKELVKRLVEIYTKEGDVVLDPFMGSGSTVLVARNLGRKGVGFEISKQFIKLAKERLSEQYLPKEEDKALEQLTKPKIYEHDARKLLDYLDPESVDLVVTSPPYWDIHRQKRTADYKEIRPYTESKFDLGNISDYGEFIGALKDIFAKVCTVLKSGKWCVIVIMDIRKKDRFYPLHMDIANMMQEVGFDFEDIIIWNRKLEYSNLRPLGYPYVFRVNKVHEYILIFKKGEMEGHT